MTEFVDRVNLDELDFSDEHLSKDGDMFTPSKLALVAVAGAAAALVGYYFYAHLDSEKRGVLRNLAVSMAKEQVNSLTSPSK